MGKIVGALATSHAFAFIEPKEWDDRRAQNRASYQRRYGREPATAPEIESETLDGNERRYGRLREAFDALRKQLVDARADVLVLIGDDQNELFTSENMPQLAIYTGGDFVLSKRAQHPRARFRSHAEFAQALLERGVRESFDFATLGRFKDDELLSHAHWQFLDHLLPELDLPVVLLVVNAIHYPAISPGRCYALGELIRRFIADRPGSERALIAASGGLSHFTAGYPWKNYRGPFGYGSISEEFDRKLVKKIEAGEGRTLADLTSEDLLEHGDIEFRGWITLLGTIGAVPSRFTVYEPFYRAIGGMGVASWPAAN